MSFDTFLRDPKAYLNVHEVVVTAGWIGTQMGPAQVLGGAAHGPAHEWTPIGGVHETMMHAPSNQFARASIVENVGRKIGVLGQRKVYFLTSQSPVDIGFRYLPFTANIVGYRRLDAAARFALTGPLSGCNIAVGRPPGGGHPIFFHSNANGVANAHANLAATRHMVNSIAANLNIAAANLLRCEYGGHGPGQYNGYGFVFGHLRNGVWKFYVHYRDTALQSATTMKIGEL